MSLLNPASSTTAAADARREQLVTWARTMPQPNAILIVSVPWESDRSGSPVPSRRSWSTTSVGSPLGAATDPTASVTTTIDGYFKGMAKRSFQAA